MRHCFTTIFVLIGIFSSAILFCPIDRDDISMCRYDSFMDSDPLISAILQKNIVRVQQIVCDDDIKASVNSKIFRCGCTPLSFAIRNHAPVAIVQALLDAGADKTITDNDRTTVFHDAARHSSLETLEVLWDETTDFNALNSVGSNMLGVLAQRLHFKTRGFNEKITDKDIQVMLFLLKKGVNPSQQDSYGHTPIKHIATIRSDFQQVGKLLSLLILFGAGSLDIQPRYGASIPMENQRMISWLRILNGIE